MGTEPLEKRSKKVCRKPGTLEGTPRTCPSARRTVFPRKGHVNLNSKNTNFDALYEKFLQWNGAGFSFEDFKYVTEMNHLADALANRGIDENRPR